MEPYDDDPAAGLPGWVVREIRRPLGADPASQRRIMARIHAMPRHGARPLPRRARRSWHTRRGWAPLTGLAAAAALGMMVTFGAARTGMVEGDRHPAAALRDTIHGAIGGATLLAVVGAEPPASVHAGVAADSLGTALLRDTLRLVRFVLVAPTATRLALVGDFNGWDRSATPMFAVAESTGTWEATVRLRSGTHRYAFVQDDTQWVAERGVGSVTVR